MASSYNEKQNFELKFKILFRETWAHFGIGKTLLPIQSHATQFPRLFYFSSHNVGAVVKGFNVGFRLTWRGDETQGDRTACLTIF